MSAISVTPRGGALTARGGWSAKTVYFQDDLVIYNGQEYQSLLPVNLNNQPDISTQAWTVPVGTSSANVVSGRAWRNAAFTLTAATWTKVMLDNIAYDTFGQFTIPPNRFVCPVAGQYLVTGELAIGAVASGQTIVSIYKNGVEASRGGYSVAAESGTAAFVVSDVLQCALNDYLELWAYSNGGQAINSLSGGTVNYMSVTLITAGQGTPGAAGPAGGVLNGTYPNPGMAVGAAATNLGAAGGALNGTYPNPSLSAGAAASNLGAAGGALSGSYPSPSLAGGAAAANLGAAGGALSGTYPSPSLSAGAAAANLGAAGGQLTGTYPNPSLASGAAANNLGAAGGALTGTYPNPAIAPVSGASWIAPTLTNGWSNLGAPYEQAGYLKDPLGFVHLKGVLQTGTTNTVAFTLPAGYRPGATGQWAGTGGAIVAQPTHVNVMIAAAGTVTLQFQGSGNYIGLSGVTFLAEN